MVTQAIEKLRPIGLRVDWLQLDPLDILATLWPFGLGIEIDTFTPLPDPANRRKGPRLASVSESTTSGSVKMSSGKRLMVELNYRPGRIEVQPHGTRKTKPCSDHRKIFPGLAEKSRAKTSRCRN